MDLHVIGPLASPAERAAVDAVLGPAETRLARRSAGFRGRTATSRAAVTPLGRRRRPAAARPSCVQERVGWISQPALNYVCAATDRAAGRGLWRRDVLRAVRDDAPTAGRRPRLRRPRLPPRRRRGDLCRPRAGVGRPRAAERATASGPGSARPCLGLLRARAGRDAHDAAGVSHRPRVAGAGRCGRDRRRASSGDRRPPTDRAAAADPAAGQRGLRLLAPDRRRSIPASLDDYRAARRVRGARAAPSRSARSG